MSVRSVIQSMPGLQMAANPEVMKIETRISNRCVPVVENQATSPQGRNKPIRILGMLQIVFVTV